MRVYLMKLIIFLALSLSSYNQAQAFKSNTAPKPQLQCHVSNAIKINLENFFRRTGTDLKLSEGSRIQIDWDLSSASMGNSKFQSSKNLEITQIRNSPVYKIFRIGPFPSTAHDGTYPRELRLIIQTDINTGVKQGLLVSAHYRGQLGGRGRSMWLAELNCD